MGWLLALALAWLQTPVAPTEALVPLAQRTRWRTLTSEAARLGDAELVAQLRGVLHELGDEDDELERLAPGWERALASARPGREARSLLARRIERELPTLVSELTRLEGERKLALARCLLALDATQPEANATLGRTRDDDGEWLTDEARTWKQRARAALALERGARALDFEFEAEESTNPALRALGGGLVVRARGLELHSALPRATLERVLSGALRASAFSRALYGGELTLPPVTKRVFVLLDTEQDLEAALSEALAARGLTGEDAAELRSAGLGSWIDARGWRTLRWRPEADVAALFLWELAPDWLGRDVQPCLSAGHLDSVCLRMLGTSLPGVAWKEVSTEAGAVERSRASTPALVRESRWRCARRSFLGCRAWMVRAVRAQSDPPWARAMVDHEGKIGGQALLKTTLACEFLQVEGRFRELCERTRGRRDLPAAFEEALGEGLPEFEARWRRWLDPERAPSVLARLGTQPDAGDAQRFEAARLALSQARADAHKGLALEFPLVELDPELMRGAALHAHYLTLNPEQKGTWPGVHEEYPGRAGFSVEGALSGARSLVALGRSPEQALTSWLATFYHRLPLLDPGLVGVGFACEEGLVVADVYSLVLDPWKDHVALWPMPDALDVPRAFEPELPNPVPGSDMAALGYPLSVQLFFVDERQHVELALELFSGEPGDGMRVPCHVLTPDAPLAPELAPRNTWGLVPEHTLAARTRYTAVARWLGQTRRWSFTTGK